MSKADSTMGQMIAEIAVRAVAVGTTSAGQTVELAAAKAALQQAVDLFDARFGPLDRTAPAHSPEWAALRGDNSGDR